MRRVLVGGEGLVRGGMFERSRLRFDFSDFGVDLPLEGAEIYTGLRAGSCWGCWVAAGAAVSDDMSFELVVYGQFFFVRCL